MLWGVVYYVCVESLKSSLRREQQKDMVLNSAYLDPHAAPSSRRGTEPGGGSSIQNHETFRPAFKKERSETSLAASHILGVSAPAQTTCARVLLTDCDETRICTRFVAFNHFMHFPEPGCL